MVDRRKYARVERERRFLLRAVPTSPPVVLTRHITDRYLSGTRLRLRHQRDPSEPGGVVYKFTQKIPDVGPGAQQGLSTNLYLSEAEFLVLDRLPGPVLTKIRHSIPPFGVDVFEGELAGLIMAETEFGDAAAADALQPPVWAGREVTRDARFTGGRLVRTGAEELRSWLEELQP